ncbi:MAG TPA: CTP synthetase [Halococcus sp.]|nr:CTP synthetase [Halococcus sp.]
MTDGIAVVAGPDSEGLGDALEAQGMTVSRVNGIADLPALEDVGIENADLYVLTDVGQATSIPVIVDFVEEIRVVVYSRESLPEFAKGQADLLLDPELLDPEIVAEELTQTMR